MKIYYFDIFYFDPLTTLGKHATEISRPRKAHSSSILKHYYRFLPAPSAHVPSRPSHCQWLPALPWPHTLRSMSLVAHPLAADCTHLPLIVPTCR